MEIDRRLSQQQDLGNVCGSLGSGFLPSGQSRKVSIGIMAEQNVAIKMKSTGVVGNNNNNNAKEGDSRKKLVERRNNNLSEMFDSLKEKQAQERAQGNSPWVSTGSYKQVTPTTTTTVQFRANKTPVVYSGSGLQERSNSVSGKSRVKMVQIYANQTMVLQSDSGAQKKFSGVACGRRKEDGSTEKVEEFAFSGGVPNKSDGVVYGRRKETDGNTEKLEEFAFSSRITKKFDGVVYGRRKEKGGNTEKVEEFAFSNGVQKKFDGVVYGRREQKQGNTEKTEEFVFAAAQEAHVSDKEREEENTEDRVNRTNTSLRQRLWEALETASSQKEKSSESKELDVGMENLNLDKQLDHNSSKAVKPKQNSDTIETDSESPDETTRRPVTRSLTQKKGSTATNPRLKQGSGKGANLHTALSSRRRPQEKNIFTFNEAEERSGSLHGISGPRLLKSTSKKSGKKESTRVEPRRISFSGKRNSKKIRRDTDSDETQPASSKTQSHSGKVEKLHLKPSEIDRENLQPTNGIRDEEQLHHSSQSKKVNQQEELSSPELPKDTSPLTGFWSGSWKNNLDPQYGAESPTLRMKATMKESFLNTSPKSIQEEQAIQSPVPDERRFVTKGFYNLRTLQKSKRGSSGVNAETDSSDDTDDLNESPIPNMESSPVMEEIDAKHRLSESSEDPEEDSGEEDQPISKGRRGAQMWTAGCNNTEISPSIIRQNKRFRQDELGPTSPSRKGILESSELEQPSNQNNDDGMMSAVSLIAKALQSFKSRIQTQTSKKSCQILASLAEEIQLQLQNVNSQIQREVLKFTNLGNSKRKSLETRFQEQHERLKSTQDKFKEEVAHHLNECKSTLEDLEAFQAELMGNAKRQKTSHQKLLAQAEKEIETQLNDTDRRITAIRKVARKNMFQLKHVVSECLKEGVFS